MDMLPPGEPYAQAAECGYHQPRCPSSHELSDGQRRQSAKTNA